MTSWKTKGAIVFGTMAIATGALTPLGPDEPSTDQDRRTTNQQQLDELSDANDRNNDRMRDEGNDGINDESRERVRSGEHRSGPKVRIRLP